MTADSINRITVANQSKESSQQRLMELLESAQSHSRREISDAFQAIDRSEHAFVVSHLSEAQRCMLIENLEVEVASEVVEYLPLIQATQLIEDVSPEVATPIIQMLPSDRRADLLSGLERNVTEQILARMAPSEAAHAKKLAGYHDESAGGLMITELLRFKEHWTVQQVIDDLTANANQYRNLHVQYAYVCNGNNQLTGVLPMRSLLLAARSQQLIDLMIRNPAVLQEDTNIERMHELFESRPYLGFPVVDQLGKLVGVVQREDFDDAWHEKYQSQFLATQGILGEEIRSLPLRERSGKRLSWLSINIVLNLIAASIISAYEPTLQQVISLAVFLPIISDMSGCSGNQAVAVSIRELMLGLIKPPDVWRVWLKEFQVGLINGLALGVMLGGIAWLWKGDAMLGFVVGISLLANTIVAVCFGGMVPLILKAFNRDPAVASGPLLTTITDMCGFFLVLSLASWLLIPIK